MQHLAQMRLKHVARPEPLIRRGAGELPFKSLREGAPETVLERRKPHPLGVSATFNHVAREVLQLLHAVPIQAPGFGLPRSYERFPFNVRGGCARGRRARRDQSPCRALGEGDTTRPRRQRARCRLPTPRHCPSRRSRVTQRHRGVGYRGGNSRDGGMRRGRGRETVYRFGRRKAG